jgi:plastocyanin
MKQSLQWHSGASCRAVMVFLAIVIAGCGGDSGPVEPPQPVLTFLAITPSTAQLFPTPPGNQVTLTVSPKDQSGNVMSGLGAPSFSSDNQAVASVSAGGVVQAISEGSARITASLTAGPQTKTVVADISVTAAPAVATVSAPALVFEPVSVHVSAGGTVNWVMAAIPHTVDFTTAGAPAPIPAFSQGTQSRAFPTPGSYSYSCGIHPSMTGVVHVH